jgi:endonuclease G
VNIDGGQQKTLRRATKADRWILDPRIDKDAQSGKAIYVHAVDLGHMVRRLDPVWGEDYQIANDDTFHFTNACPQHKDLNRRIWVDLEKYILSNTGDNQLKVTVFTGPVLDANDPPYRGIQMPQQYWKVAVMIHPDTGKLHATAYILSQADMVTGLEFAFGEFKTYQLPITELEKLAHLDFGKLRKFDPKARRAPSDLESVGETFTEITSAKDLVL